MTLAKKIQESYLRGYALIKEAERQGESGQSRPSGDVWSVQGEIVRNQGPNSSAAQLLLDAFARGRKKHKCAQSE